VVKSNEKPSVCNTFAALYLKNPVNMGTYSSPNVNKSYQRDNFFFEKTKFINPGILLGHPNRDPGVFYKHITIISLGNSPSNSTRYIQTSPKQ